MNTEQSHTTTTAKKPWLFHCGFQFIGYILWIPHMNFFSVSLKKNNKVTSTRKGKLKEELYYISTQNENIGLDEYMIIQFYGYIIIYQKISINIDKNLWKYYKKLKNNEKEVLIYIKVIFIIELKNTKISLSIYWIF